MRSHAFLPLTSIAETMLAVTVADSESQLTNTDDSKDRVQHTAYLIW